MYSPCSGCPLIPQLRELAVTITDPEQRAVRHFFSVATAGDPDGWLASEFGLPFTRSVNATPYHSAGGGHRDDPVTGEPRFLSMQILNNGVVERETYITYEGDGLGGGPEARAQDWRTPSRARSPALSVVGIAYLSSPISFRRDAPEPAPHSRGASGHTTLGRG